MKKLLLLLALFLIIVGCSNSEAGTVEVDSFKEDFNENAFEFSEVSLLKEEDFYESDEENGVWKFLSESDNHKLALKYNDDQFAGYYISADEEFNVGYQNAMVVAKTIGIDQQKFKQAFEKARDTEEEVTYEEEDYEIKANRIMDLMTVNIHPN